MSCFDSLSKRNWELSCYELHRIPQGLITDNTEVAILPRSLRAELRCPICLDLLKNTMTTKECLHRFCQECIVTALRSGNKECPNCRKKLVSKRSLRPDPNFDMLISKIYPNREEYEAHQERELAEFNIHRNLVAKGINYKLKNRTSIANGVHPVLKSKSSPLSYTKGTLTPIPAPIPSPVSFSQLIGEVPSALSQKKRKLSLEADTAPRQEEENAKTESSQELAQESSLQLKKKWKLPVVSGVIMKKQLQQEENEKNETEISERESQELSAQPHNKQELGLEANASMEEKKKNGAGISEAITQGLSSKTKKEQTLPVENDAIRREKQTKENNAEAESSEGLDQDPGASNEIELIFKPYPDDLANSDPDLLQIRYIKTTANATVDHLSKYLATRTALDRKPDDSTTKLLTDSSAFSIFVATIRKQFQLLEGSLTLHEVNEKYWKVNKPLEMYFALKKP